jgi:hypothetical protein
MRGVINTGRFFETRWSPEAVILSVAKDLSAYRDRCYAALNMTTPLAVILHEPQP